MKDFESLDLFAPLKRAVAEQNYKTPTPIQAQTIPPAIDGTDILGCAQTGTGKTAAFALPILDYIGHEQPQAKPNRPVTLILAPTRELAIQIGDSFAVYGKYMKFRQALVYGGVSQGRQVNALRQGVHVLVATPGRLIDLMDQGHINLRDIEILVLDEADRMLDMGFLPALKKIIATLPEKRQSMFFSATMPPKIRELANRLLFNPVSIDVTPESPSVKKIEQQVKLVQRADKISALQDILEEPNVQRTIVFTRTKHGANQVAKKLDRAGFRTAAIHGNKSQNARQRALEAFRKKEITILVATDVAARGIDIDGVTHVINYDMPVEAESYVHRIGRTGRAGATGIAISFCTPDERDELRAIESLIDLKLPIESINDCPGFNENPTPRPKQGSNSRRHGQRGRTNSRGPNARSSNSRSSNSRSSNGRSANGQSSNSRNSNRNHTSKSRRV